LKLWQAKGGEGSPAGNEALHDDANDIGDYPVKGQAAGELHGEKGEHDGHHPQHRSVHL